MPPSPDTDDLLERLRCTNEEFMAFQYHVSHDLNAPILAVRGLLGLIVDDVQAGRSDELSEMLGEALAQLDRLDALIADLLSLARTGVDDDDHTEVDLRELVDDVVASLSLHSRELELSVGLSYDAPALRTQRVRLRQILANLVSNAKKFSDPEELAPRIDIRVACAPDALVVSVHDNGIGMSPDVAASAFEMFTRGSARHPGHGLGLYIVRKHAERLGASVRVAHSRKPTVIELRLPPSAACASG